LQNAGKLSTKGLEIALSGTPIKTQIFHVGFRVNYTQFKSLVDELAPGIKYIF
jgi:hypothetical protein